MARSLEHICLSWVLFHVFVRSSFSHNLYFEKQDFSHFQKHVIATITVYDDFACLLRCKHTEGCTAINLGDQPNKEGLYTCDLIRHEENKYTAALNQPTSYSYVRLSHPCNTSPCLHNFACIPDYADSTYECSCPRPAFEGKHCKDVNECTTGKHDCSENAICTNTIGSFNCTCKDGYFGNGKTCHNVTNLESDILTDYGNSSYHAALKRFMDEVPEDVMNISWIRCWSGKEDGFDVATTFHPQCDGKGPTVTLARKKDYVWGGYSDVPWSSDLDYRISSRKSFIFSLYNVQGFNPMKFDLVYRGVVVKHTVGYGPVFSEDVCIGNDAATSSWSYNEPTAYATPPGCGEYPYCNFFTDISGRYTIDDVEVFYKQAV